MHAIQGVVLVIGVFLASGVSAKLSCDRPAVDIPNGWRTMVDPCIKKMQEQVQEELTAAMTYLALGAHFARDVINRPGFANMFFESASEEREHAIKIIEYLLMRGQINGAGSTDISTLIRDPRPLDAKWTDGLSALKVALNLETSVTKKIRGILEVCENPGTKDGSVVGSGEGDNDYHLVDYLSGDFLDEQYKGQRKFAGMISTLGKMIDSHGQLAEFLFDKKLLNGEAM